MVAKSQHLPDDRWFVTGEPSNSTLVLKTCEPARREAGFWRIETAALEVRATRASLFYPNVSGRSSKWACQRYLWIRQKLLLPSCCSLNIQCRSCYHHVRILIYDEVDIKHTLSTIFLSILLKDADPLE